MKNLRDRFKFKSLTMRIWTTFTAVILIIICSISLIYLATIRRNSENERLQSLKSAHEYLLQNNNLEEPAVGFDRFNKNLKDSASFIYSVTDGVKEIVDINRRPMQSHGDTPPQNFMVMDQQTKAWMATYIKDTNISEKQFKASKNGVSYLFIISSMKSSTSQQAYLITFMPNMQDNSLLYLVATIGGIFIVLGFVAAKIVAGYIAKPLRELEKFTVRIAQKDWKEPITVKYEDEIGRLAASMNHMQMELKRADEEEKMFLNSISHDLKTPVMVIASHADAIIDGVYIDSVEETAEIIKDEAISLEKKIKQMLYLNTLDYVLENNDEDSEIKMHDMLLHIINRFEVINSEIEWDLDMDKITIKGNEDKIKVAIENILDNGLRYAKELIRISLKKEDSYAVLDIFNDGPQIDAKHIDHIFDNHYKDKTGNFGLGLAISKKIVNFYKGQIKAVNRENGVSFIIKYPI